MTRTERSPNVRRSRRAQAFTMVELMMVITIIGVLVAILLPGLGAAQQFANNLQCQNNLSQLARSVLGYATDSKGALPPTCYTTTERYWCTILVKYNYVAGENTAELGLTEASSRGSVFKCPLATDQIFRPGGVTISNPGSNEAQATARLGNNTFKVDCSYYWNGCSKVVVTTIPMPPTTVDPRYRLPSLGVDDSRPPAYQAQQNHDLSEITNRTQTVMLADGILFQEGSINKALIAARHPGDSGERSRTNVVYYDGHTDSLERIPGLDKQYRDDMIMKSTNLEMQGAPSFLLPKR